MRKEARSRQYADLKITVERGRGGQDRPNSDILTVSIHGGHWNRGGEGRDESWVDDYADDDVDDAGDDGYRGNGGMMAHGEVDGRGSDGRDDADDGDAGGDDERGYGDRTTHDASEGSGSDDAADEGAPLRRWRPRPPDHDAPCPGPCPPSPPHSSPGRRHAHAGGEVDQEQGTQVRRQYETEQHDISIVVTENMSITPEKLRKVESNLHVENDIDMSFIRRQCEELSPPSLKRRCQDLGYLVMRGCVAILKYCLWFPKVHRGPLIMHEESETRRRAVRHAEDVVFQGSVGLLSLRGGGPPPGAGILNWLDEDDSMDQARRAREDKDGGSERVDMERSMRAWDESWRPHGEGESCPEVADGQTKTITGARGERKIQICPHCMSDVPIMEWASHICGGRAGPRDAGSCDAPEEHRGHGVDQGTYPREADQWDWRHPEWYFTESDGAQNDRVISGGLGNCARCDAALGGSTRSWRICRCRAAACEACWGLQCARCSIDRVWSGGGQRSPEQGKAAMDEVRASGGLGDPGWVSPSEARGLAVAAAETRKRRMGEARKLSNASRSRQCQRGERPRRDGGGNASIEIVSANVTAATSLIEELKHGRGIGAPDVLMVQELAADPASTETFATEMMHLGRTPVIERSYFKNSGYGGGTAIITPGVGGVRPQPPPAEMAKGRLCFGILCSGVEITMACIYGISGRKAKDQLCLWKHLADRLRVLGRPFVIGGDWQVGPRELAATQLDKFLDASIVAPSTPTNKVTGSCIDFFLISNVLMSENTAAEAVTNCSFSPHLPVRTVISIESRIPRIRTISVPKLLPEDRPIGPQLPARRVNWEGWGEHDDGKGVDIELVEKYTDEWHAGIELELMGVFGHVDDSLASPYLGIGRLREECQMTAERQFRHTPDWHGRLGHHLAWVARQLHYLMQQGAVLRMFGMAVVAAHGKEAAVKRQAKAAKWVRENATSTIMDEDLHAAASQGLPWQYVICRRIGLRAAVLLRMRDEGIGDAQDREAWRTLQCGFRHLAALSRGVHGRRPVIDQWCGGEGAAWLDEAAAIRSQADAAHHEFATRRAARKLKENRHWAATASYRTAHRVTKEPEAITRLSASANKQHLGEASPQEAADRGMAEWKVPWDATTDNCSEDVMREVEAVQAMNERYSEIPLPPITDEDVHRGGRMFHGRTGVGGCGLRPRHVLLASRGARQSLGKLLMMIESCRRWPKSVWAVVEVALSKRTGGARLVGLSASVYRLWARIRYWHCRTLLEQRIARPYLAAAPRRGAARAAFEAARVAEVATARSETAVGTMIDVSQVYE